MPSIKNLWIHAHMKCPLMDRQNIVDRFCHFVQFPPLCNNIFRFHTLLRVGVQEALICSRRCTLCELRPAFGTGPSCFADTMTVFLLEFSQVKLECDFEGRCGGFAERETAESCKGGIFGLVLVEPRLGGLVSAELELCRRVKQNTHC